MDEILSQNSLRTSLGSVPVPKLHEFKELDLRELKDAVQSFEARRTGAVARRPFDVESTAIEIEE